MASLWRTIFGSRWRLHFFCVHNKKKLAFVFVSATPSRSGYTSGSSEKEPDPGFKQTRHRAAAADTGDHPGSEKTRRRYPPVPTTVLCSLSAASAFIPGNFPKKPWQVWNSRRDVMPCSRASEHSQGLRERPTLQFHPNFYEWNRPAMFCCWRGMMSSRSLT